MIGRRRDGGKGPIESPQLKETPNYQSEGFGNIGKRFDLATGAVNSVALSVHSAATNLLLRSMASDLHCGNRLAFPNSSSL